MRSCGYGFFCVPHCPTLIRVPFFESDAKLVVGEFVVEAVQFMDSVDHVVPAVIIVHCRVVLCDGFWVSRFQRAALWGLNGIVMGVVGQQQC